MPIALFDIDGTLLSVRGAGRHAVTAALLHQTRGVLRVVEVFGGALLAEEMEQTAGFMARGGDARQQADGLDALMRSVVQLPTVITSYSIHYTKLYEPDQAVRALAASAPVPSFDA